MAALPLLWLRRVENALGHDTVQVFERRRFYYAT
jgi:hypothetical protein